MVLHDASTAFRFHLRSGFERALFAKMEEEADACPQYAARLLEWLLNGSTLELRELARPFGDYWRSLSFANVVDGLDSASCRMESFAALEKRLERLAPLVKKYGPEKVTFMVRELRATTSAPSVVQ